jgi:hypothetical protein
LANIFDGNPSHRSILQSVHSPPNCSVSRYATLDYIKCGQYPQMRRGEVTVSQMGKLVGNWPLGRIRRLECGYVHEYLRWNRLR